MGVMLSAVAGYFSVIGLATIFAGAFWSVIVMASALELSKLVAAAWIYRCWSIAPYLMRFYMVTAVVVLVFITSMGIFGYLSKAHLEQTINQGGNNELLISGLERKIERQQSIIDDSETVLAQLDSAVEILQDYDRIRGPDGAIAVRKAQAEERTELNRTIGLAYDQIAGFQEQLLPLQKQTLELEAEIGPLKYIAELIYGEDRARDYFDVAVRWIIILLISVFDPMAVCLILAGNTGINILRPQKEVKYMTGDEVMRKVNRDGHNRDG